MKRITLFLGFVTALAVVAIAQQPPVPDVPEIPFESVPNYFKYPPAMNLGDLPAVAVNSKGHVFMLSRSNISGPAYAPMAAQVLEFDQLGNYVREIGKGLYAFSYGHGIRVDKHDNIWVADKGSDMVVKFNPIGHVEWVFGRRAESSEPNGQGPPKVTLPTVHVDSQFHQPTDMAWDSAGNTYISDGYLNARVAVFDKDGTWVKSFGSRGTGPGQFSSLHAIAIDANDNIYIADRSNVRIQVFDKNFKFLRQFDTLSKIPYPPDIRSWTSNTPDPHGDLSWSKVNINTPGAPWALCITPGPTQYLYTSDGFPGRIYKLTLDGKVVGMLGRSGRKLGQFGWPHGLACPSENVVYVADENNFRVQKLILHPEKTHPTTGH